MENSESSSDPPPPEKGDGDGDENIIESNVHINDLPDEILENIFSRASPYNDFDAIKCVCKRWNNLSKNVVSILLLNFEKSLVDGGLDLEVLSSPGPPLEKVKIIPGVPGQIGQSWISERFGHMCCYYDKSIYVCGGTTSAQTTFNDMWRFDLTLRTWSRCIISSGQYPTPKALASFVQYKDNFILFGGWSYPPPYPLMQAWKIFDELHIYNFKTNRWTQLVSEPAPNPTAGHSASVHGHLMLVFGGRTFDISQQSFPLSNGVWVFDILSEEWSEMKTTNNGPVGPVGRYGQTQIALDEWNLLVIGGCGGPNQIFSDSWLLHFEKSNSNGNGGGQFQNGGGGYRGCWTQMKVKNQGTVPYDFHYSGCKIGEKVLFCERSSKISPFLAFLHFDQSSLPQTGLRFEPNSRSSYFHSNCSSGLKKPNTANNMPVYTLDISKVLSDNTVEWIKESEQFKSQRPAERLLYSMVPGRAELILFGGFYRDFSNVLKVSSDVFILKTVQKSY